MKSTILNGELIRATREGRGLTQLELSRIAGVSERTIRNAENGRSIRPDFAEYIARALHYSLSALELPIAEVHDLNRSADRSRDSFAVWTRYASRMMRIVAEFVETGSVEAILSILHVDVQLRSNSTPPTPINGTYKGIDEVRKYFDQTIEFLKVCPRGDFLVERVYGNDNIVIFSGYDDLFSPSEQKHLRYWFNWIFTHQDGCVIDMVQTFGLKVQSDAKPE